MMPNGKILLVDDNPSDVELTIRAFEKNGITNKLVVAKDGREALDYLFATSKLDDTLTNNLPALVLLDLKLPVINGLGVLKQIKSNPLTQSLIVVILTTSIEQKDIASAYKLGANSYIRKSVDFFEFVKAIKQMSNYWLQLNQSFTNFN